MHIKQKVIFGCGLLRLPITILCLHVSCLLLSLIIARPYSDLSICLYNDAELQIHKVIGDILKGKVVD